MPQGGILIIDDHRVIRLLCQNLLKALGVPIYAATNARGGLALADTYSPDIILLDIGLPDLDGLTVLKQLRKDSLHRQNHIIMLTADTNVDSVVECLKEGASDYLKKPFTGRELVARVKNLLQHRQYERIIAEDLEKGAALQKKFLTPETDLLAVLKKCGYKVQSYNRPCATVSGDFFYPVSFSKSSCGLFFADTCGHGLSAALISMRIIGSLHTMSYANNSPANYLQLLNEDLQGVLPRGHFIAACYMFFQQDTMILANAGQPYPIRISRETIEEIPVGGYPIGQLAEPWYNNEFIRLESGDRLLLYSDGLVEAQNEAGDYFGKEHLLQILTENKTVALEEMVATVVRVFEEFCGNVIVDDDVTLIALEKERLEKYEIRIANTQQAIGEFVEQFRKMVLQRYIVTEKQQDVTEYVLVECLDNAWEHGNKKDPDKEIFLCWSICNYRLTVSVEDQGEGFLVEIPKTMPPLTNPRGRGLYTLQDLTEELWYNRTGNKVTFTIARWRITDE